MANYTRNQLQNSQLQPRAPYLSPDLCPPVGGYNKLTDNEMGSIEIGRTLQLYASRPITSALTPDPDLFFNANTKEIEMCSSQLTSKGERLWLVVVNAIEVIRIADPGSGAIPRLSADTILNSNFPRYSTLQAMVKWADSSANSHIVKLDISGGTKFKVFGRNVQVYILAPENAQIIESSNAPQVDLTGITLNEMVSAKIAPLTIGVDNLDILKYTWNQGVPATETAFVEIPPGARKVRILNATVGVATSEMYFWLTDDPVNGHIMGIIDFTGDQTSLLEIPVGATHISTGTPNAIAGRCFSFIFTIDP